MTSNQSSQTSRPSSVEDDNKVFEFDPLESITTGVGVRESDSIGRGGFLEGSSLSSPSSFWSYDPLIACRFMNLDIDGTVPTQWEIDEDLVDASSKGKGVSEPIAEDPLDASFSKSRRSPSRFDSKLPFPRPPSPLAPPPFNLFADSLASSNHDSFKKLSSTDGAQIGLSIVKGKARESPPSLPPLDFSSSEFDYGRTAWPSVGSISSTPGPSSYGSVFTSIGDALSNAGTSPPVPPTPAHASNESSPTIRRMPSRAHSLSNLSIHSARSVVPRLRSKLGVRSTIARKLLFRKRESSSNPNSRPTSVEVGDFHAENVDIADIHTSSCFLPWRADIKPRASFVNLNTDIDLRAGRRRQNQTIHSKGRSNSSPFPPSTFDLIPALPRDVFEPIPIKVKNYFDYVLPRELRLEVFASLVALHQREYENSLSSGKWTMAKATSSKNKHVGRDKGIRELIKFSRVSKSWQSLVFDGQLWSKLNLSAFPKMPAPLLLRLAQAAGPFIKDLDLSGNTRLLSATLIRLTDELCPKVIPLGGVGDTQLTTVNLHGCTALTTRALHHLLMRCPSLQSLCLKGLKVVTNNTFEVLAMCCPNLVSLDLSMCPKLDGEGIQSWIASSPPLLLKELRLSGIKRITDDVMKILGRGLPNLEVLDLSYVSELHNSAIDAFVSYDDGESQPEVETVLLTSRQVGRDPASTTRYRRRVTRLRHLSLSSCVLLTDIACSHLAYAVPRLEYLELAGVGAELKDDGLVRLLGTTPRIRRLDLEDASDMSDAVLVVLTPRIIAEAPVPASVPAAALEPGHLLEELVISYAVNVTDDAMRALMRACPRLRVLEADNTRMSGSVLKEFVRLAKGRGISNARAVAIDCRGVGEAVVKELSGSTRPRLGWRAYGARKLAFLDARDGEDLRVGQDECDEQRVVLKSFYSWQTVDAVRAAREKRRKAPSRRAANESTGNTSDSEESVTQPNANGRARWWSPSGRSGGSNPSNGAEGSEREGCRIM